VRQLIIAVVIALASTSCTGSGGGGDEANTELQSRNEQLKQQLELAEQRADEAEAALAVDEEEGDERQTDDPDSDATIEGDESSEAGASVGEVEHGAWQLIVEPSPECMNGVAFIYDGLEDEEHSAQGQFCLVRVEVEHLGDSPEFLWPRSGNSRTQPDVPTATTARFPARGHGTKMARTPKNLTQGKPARSRCSTTSLGM
jgi:hypothetical protein